MMRGRPLSFDKDKTLETILNVFWDFGYVGTSYTDLCKATGLTKPSLYAAFGNKEETFLAALERYLDRFVRPGEAVLEIEPDPRQAVRKLLAATVFGLTSPDTPPGCMIAANISCANAPDVPKRVSDALHSAVKETPEAIHQRLMIAEPQFLPPDSTPNSLAFYFEVIISGLSSLARQGASQAELLPIIDRVMQGWEENSRS